MVALMRPFFEANSAKRVIAQHALDLSYSDRKVWARVYEPTLEADGYTWSCRITIGEPFDIDLAFYQVTSLLALMASLRILSMELYISPEWREKELGFNGEFGGDLGIPAGRYSSHVAPYSF